MNSFFVKPFYDVGILILRIFGGGFLFFAHGLSKITSFNQMLNKFADPLGLGPEITFLFAVFAEGFCTWLVIIGLFTRIAVVPIIITMLTAGIIVHANDPFGVAEKPLLFAVIFIAILITGPGRLSIDALLRGKGKVY